MKIVTKLIHHSELLFNIKKIKLYKRKRENANRDLASL